MDENELNSYDSPQRKAPLEGGGCSVCVRHSPGPDPLAGLSPRPDSIQSRSDGTAGGLNEQTDDSQNERTSKSSDKHIHSCDLEDDPAWL